MRSFLFPRLTRRQPRGRALFDALVAEARQPHWFIKGEVPDTIDGRFSVLATVLAVTIVRLERSSSGEAEREAAVALTERFVETMDAEHRQIGLGDPSIGKHVRKLVASLGRRVEQWQGALESGDWSGAASASLYRKGCSPAALEHSVSALRSLWNRLASLPDAALAEGRIG